MQTPNAHQIIFLLLIAAIVSMAARKLRLPSSAGLVMAGLLLAFLPFHGPKIGLTSEVLFTAFLPALIFESALNLSWKSMREDWAPLTIFITLGVVVNLAITAAGMHFIAGWPWGTALLFGALTAATDPIAVLATFKDAGIRGRARLLAESESLLNDGVAVVAFGLVTLSFSPVSSTAFTAAAGLSLAQTVGGGLAAGIIVGYVLAKINGNSHDALIGCTLTAVAAYGSYFLALEWHGSGILATVASGLVIGSTGMFRDDLVSHSRDTIEGLWEFAAFIANALVFILIGLTLAHYSLRPFAGHIAIAILVALVARATAVYLCSAIFTRSRWKLPMSLQHLLVWGGQRGGLSLVLAVSAASIVADPAEMISCTAGLVVFSVLVQGLTFRPLLKSLTKKQSLEEWK